MLQQVQETGRIIETPEIKRQQGWLASLVLRLYSHRHMAAHIGHRHMAAYIGFKHGNARAVWSRAVLCSIRTAITVWERLGLGPGA